MTLDLHHVAQAIYEANRDHGIEDVLIEPWDQLQTSSKTVYLNLAGTVLTTLRISYVADEPC